MKWSETFIPTLREAPQEAEIPSHILMLRSGMLSKLSSGLYTFLPLGQIVLEKVKNIIRNEMNREGALEVFMPALQPIELWEKSGRKEIMEGLMLRVKDRVDREFALGPTHEEVITQLASQYIKSYRDMPKNFYQIQTKFRDEIRPRFGLMRAKEFIMKDAYSFDQNEEDAQLSYQKMYRAYQKIFKKCGLDAVPVLADTGVMGGLSSHEFMVLADSGEDEIILCSECHYTANKELAIRKRIPEETLIQDEEFKEVHTPNMKSVEELVAFLHKDKKDFIKAMVYKTKDHPVVALCRGDHEINESKLAKVLGESVQMVQPDEIYPLTKTDFGFTGPIGLNVPIIADDFLKDSRNKICGSGKRDFHLTGVQLEEQVDDLIWADITSAVEGDICSECGSVLITKRGIEIGHVFLLGKKYTEKMDATFLNSDGKKVFSIMGCYGIGVTRLIAAYIEANHDQQGIIWSKALTPYQVHLIPLNLNDELIQKSSHKLYDLFLEHNFEVLLDDRDERAGVKFNDADLLGIPIRIVLGKKSLENGQVELVYREGLKKELVKMDQVFDCVRKYYATGDQR